MFLILAVHDVLQILSVLILFHDLIDFHQLISADPSVQICDFFQASNLTMLMLLDSLYEVGGIHQALMCTCIQPSKALTQQFYIQGAVFQINTVQIGNFQFTTGRRFQVLGKLDHTIIIEVQASHTVVTLRMFWLLFDRNGLTVLVKLHNAETLRIVHIVPKHRCALAVFRLFHCCV